MRTGDRPSDRTLAVLAVVALVALAGCAGLAGGDNPNGEDGPDRTVEVATTGEATAEPDQATLHVAVLAEGSDPEAVRTDLAESDDELRASLIEFGLTEDDIRTDHYSVREHRDSREDPKVDRFVGEHRYEIDVDDVGSVGDVIDVAVDGGADQVGRISFGVSEERETELREEALEDAMANAHDDANVLAAQADLEVVGVYTVTTADTSVRGHTARFTDDVTEEAAADAATGIQAGDVDVTVDVRVVFEAEQ